MSGRVQPTLLRERPRNARIVLAVIVPFLFGCVLGVALGVSAGLYWALSALAALGAVLAGLEHESFGEGARRGLLGGSLFALGILVLHAITGAEEQVSLGSFPPLLIVIDAIAGGLLSGLGGHLSARRRPPRS